MNGYLAFYKGNKIEVHANSQSEARTIAVQQFKARKAWDVSVVLTEKDGVPVTHSTASVD